MEFSKDLQKFIKKNLEQIHNIEITETNIRDVVFLHFINYRKMSKKSKPSWKNLLTFWKKN